MDTPPNGRRYGHTGPASASKRGQESQQKAQKKTKGLSKESGSGEKWAKSRKIFVIKATNKAHTGSN